MVYNVYQQNQVRRPYPVQQTGLSNQELRDMLEKPKGFAIEVLSTEWEILMLENRRIDSEHRMTLLFGCAKAFPSKEEACAELNKLYLLANVEPKYNYLLTGRVVAL